MIFTNSTSHHHNNNDHPSKKHRDANGDGDDDIRSNDSGEGGSSEDVQYCFINVGRAAGKIKFCMLDKANSYIGEFYNLRAVLLRDNDTGDAAVHVLAFPSRCVGCDDGQRVKTIQEIVWNLHHPKSNVTMDSLTHINSNTMDNRIHNLALKSPSKYPREKIIPSHLRCLIQQYREPDPSVLEKLSPPVWNDDRAATDDVYTQCASQLVPLTHWVNVPEPIRHVTDTCDSSSTQVYSLLHYKRLSTAETGDVMSSLHECHYLPCTNLERRPLQYDSCGACRSVRYCSSECQLNDWSSHKEHCSLIQYLYIQSQSSVTSNPINHDLSASPSIDLSLEVER